MRASRLLHILLLLQNRGRMTSLALAAELEVTPRTILRDVDAMTEAGLPIIVHRGREGGIELGFNYRTRLTGLDAAEAEALAVILSDPGPMVQDLGIGEAARRAASKLRESFPDRVRDIMAVTEERFRVSGGDTGREDPRVPALARAIRDGLTVTFAARSDDPKVRRLASLDWHGDSWTAVSCDGDGIAQADWGDLNISRLPV